MTEKVDSPETIWVGMRLRPLVEREKGQPHCLRIEGTEVHVVEEALDSERRMELHRASFAFDVAMDSTDPSKPEYISQEKCYEIMGGRMVQHMLQGFNTCLFCYGQTGTGKTTTIMGSAQPRRERGLLMRLVDDVFVEAGKQQDAGCQVHVVMQMLEVYNEKLNDLSAEAEPNPPSPNSLKKPIKIHVHPELGVYLTGATEAPVKNAEECIKTIEYGNTMKVVHATAMNAQSSRGHTICKLTVVKEGGKDNVTSNSEVYFADLAGRENERSTQVTGERFVELGFINKSLHHLSNCIRDLGQTEKRRKTICAEALRAKVAPGPNDMSKFRNSKLTLLLSNALSGNSRTSMIGTLSPASSNFEESHNTLKFASTVKTIKVQAKAAKALDKDALVRDLKNEILELRKQLEQAKEKHDDEALKEIADHLEASHAIVAAQTRDWVDFEEENAELSKKRARSFIRSSSHEMFPYLANHSEDPHLCFKLVMHVPEGKEQSLGSDISSDFRLPPALGVCETTGYIRNQGGCLTLRPAAAPSGRSGRFASIEVNGNKLSREQELHHLDCVLFGRSTSFYVFLQHASAEEVDERLRASRADMEDWDGRITQPLVDKILGEARSKDPAEVKLAREYCDLLRGQNRDSEGELMLRAFMCQARRARVKVDEANELTRCVRPSSGLHFELAAQAPVLSYGFYRCANLPELCVRLVRRTRFRAAVRKVMAQLKKQNLIQAAVRSFLPAKSESISSDYQLLSTWTLPKFYARLEMMYEVRQNQLDDPSIKLEKLDKWKDPWAECGVAEVEALQEEHRLQIEDLRDRNRKRETEIQEAAQQQLQRLQEELKAANAELLRRNDKPREVEAEGRPTPPGFNGAQAPGLVARCLELGKANKALLESLCVEQREGFEP